jgi:hypothetical protein
MKCPVVEVLYVEECPHYLAALALIERVQADLGIEAEIRIRLIPDRQAAEQARFVGSPTVRVDGRDIEPGVGPPPTFRLACRLYRHDHGLTGQPPEQWVRDALVRAAGAAC